MTVPASQLRGTYHSGGRILLLQHRRVMPMPPVPPAPHIPPITLIRTECYEQAQTEYLTEYKHPEYLRNYANTNRYLNKYLNAFARSRLLDIFTSKFETFKFMSLKRLRK
ncbi:hypothetical protein F8M41_008866 [Gigaspora margarita]|uniref:Uncharacterized protein n=1 Tax=Gigaspora margarita TaxID=4874 RepID=A0A8H4A2B0_GIGMA|nr:hypothetical protein F8M41_008866 [Gigaspora margarita]